MNLVVECNRCGNSYAQVLLQDERPRCRCGTPLPAGPTPQFVDRESLQAEEANLRELKRMADFVSFLIVATDTPKIDVEIKGAELKRRCAELYPEKAHLYDLLYKSRFHRLWDQFRSH